MILERNGNFMEKTRTMAFQVSEETFTRLKAYLKRHKVKQKAFVVGLVEAALDKKESGQQAGQDTDNCP